MSLRKAIINSCLNKEIAYANRELAATKAAFLAANKFRFGLEPYECEFCRKWHLGHPTLYKPVSEFSYWCQDVFECLVPMMRNAKRPQDARRAYDVAKKSLQMGAARAFINLKGGIKHLNPTLLKKSCKQTGLVQAAAVKRLNEVYLEVVRGFQLANKNAGSNAVSVSASGLGG